MSRTPDQLATEAYALYQKGHHDKAIKLWDRLLKVETNVDSRASAFLFKGESYCLTERYKKALRMIDKALHLKNNKYAEAWRSKSSVYLQLNDPARALVCAKRAKKFGLGNSMNEAIETCKQAQRDKPGALQFVARAFFGGGRRSGVDSTLDYDYNPPDSSGISNLNVKLEWEYHEQKLRDGF